MPPFTADDTELYRRDVRARGQILSAEERSRLLQPYLPPAQIDTPPEIHSDTQQFTPTHTPKVKARRLGHRRRIRPFIKNKIHALLYFIIHLIFGIYVRIRQIYHATYDRILAITYYHHRTPEYIRKDVQGLSRLPEHLSVILQLKPEEDGGVEALIDEVAELCAWSTAVGIPLLSVYEKSGILKSYMSSVYDLVTQKLVSYYGKPPLTPGLRVLAPNHTAVSSSLSRGSKTTQATNGMNTSPAQRLNLLLLSSTDGRDTLVDLTRTLTEMSQNRKLSPSAITMDLINAEIQATTSLPTPPHSPPPETDPLRRKHVGNDSDIGPGEPELLIVFGPLVKLDGYPPWQIRLTEIFCVGDSGGDISGRSATRVEYQGFMRGLWRYAGAEMRFGR